jgi:hypothetical protein
VAYLAIEGEVRQLLAVYAVFWIPTRIPRDARDIPPLPDMPAYAWTVLALTVRRGADQSASCRAGRLVGWHMLGESHKPLDHRVRRPLTRLSRYVSVTRYQIRSDQGIYLVA